MNRVDRRRVRAAFSRQARRYDDHAEVQARVRERFAAFVAEHAPAPRLVLDVGAGTGALLARLLCAHPGLSAAGVDLAPGMTQEARRAAPRALIAAADAEALPFRTGSFDLVLSTSTFQWLAHLEVAFAEARRVLAPGGAFCFALFCGETLHELRDAHRHAATALRRPDDRTHRFFAPPEVERALRGAGLELRAMVGERIVERHPDARAVLRSLKRIGAGNAAPTAQPGLAGRRLTLEMLRLYEERHHGREGVPATYEVLYVASRRLPAES